MWFAIKTAFVLSIAVVVFFKLNDTHRHYPSNKKHEDRFALTGALGATFRESSGDLLSHRRATDHLLTTTVCATRSPSRCSLSDVQIKIAPIR